MKTFGTDRWPVISCRASWIAPPLLTWSSSISCQVGEVIKGHPRVTMGRDEEGRIRDHTTVVCDSIKELHLRIWSFFLGGGAQAEISVVYDTPCLAPLGPWPYTTFGLWYILISNGAFFPGHSGKIMILLIGWPKQEFLWRRRVLRGRKLPSSRKHWCSHIYTACEHAQSPVGTTA